MNRTLKLSIMLALAMGGSQALAQSLGAVQVHSTMDQPLSADIPLTGVTGNPGDIKVTLASVALFLFMMSMVTLSASEVKTFIKSWRLLSESGLRTSCGCCTMMRS